MADGTTQLNTNATSGDYMDEEEITYGSAPTTRKRPRVVITGSAASVIVEPGTAQPSPTAVAVPMRQAGELPAGTQIIGKVEVYDGTNVIGTSAHPVRTDPTGSTIQPISAASLPLPTGAAQDSTLTGGTAKTQMYDGSNVIGTSGHPVRIDPTGSTTQPVSAASLPLPSGAATEATLAARLGKVTAVPVAFTYNTSGDHDILDPGGSAKVRLKKIRIKTPSTNTALVTFQIKLGTTVVFQEPLEIVDVFQWATVRESASNGDKLVINLSANQTVYINADLETF